MSTELMPQITYGPVRAIASTTVPERFRAHARSAPERVAVTDDRGIELSYGQLDRRANRLAHHLRRSGVRAGSACAIVQERAAHTVVSILAVLKAGAAYVPLDPNSPRLRLTELVNDIDAAAVLTDSVGAEAAVFDARPVIPVDADASVAAHCPEADPAVPLTPASAAYVIYTSGSTGTPKGVLVEHGAVTHFADMVEDFFQMSGEDRVAQCAALWFDVSVFEILGALLTGASVHIAGPLTRSTPGELHTFMRQRRITALMTTPSLLELLDPADLPDLRVMSIGGEPFTAELTGRWSPGRRFINGYGPAEATVEVVAKVCEGAFDGPPPIGLPLANHRAFVLTEAMRPVEPGEPGELYVGGPGLARGYLGRPALTAASFRPDPFSSEPGARLYRTGDRVCQLPSGDLQFLGRVDRQVKVRGMRVELGEVEHALARHPDVQRAAVVAVADGADTELVAFVVSGSNVEPEDVRATAAAHLPDFMVPRDILSLDALPLTDSGKVDIPALEASAALHATERRTGRTEDATPPRTETERVVVRIVSDVVGVESLGVDQDVFAAGANSLQVLRVLSRVRTEFGIVVTPQTFFENPSAAGIAAALDARRAHV